MWYAVAEVIRWRRKLGTTLVIVKSHRRFKPPKWIMRVAKPRAVSEVTRLSDLGVVIKGDGREYIKQYLGKWMEKEEFLDVMRCALLRSYKNMKTVERMFNAVKEFVDRPLAPKQRPPRRAPTKVYELSQSYPPEYIADRAKLELGKTIKILVFSKTMHLCPKFEPPCATVVIPLETDKIEDVELSDRGLETLKLVYEKLLPVLETSRPEIAEKLKYVFALVNLLS